MSGNQRSTRRSIFRFSLRAVLLLVTSLCIGLGIWTQRAKTQRRAALLIEQSGGHVDYLYEVRRFPGGDLAFESPLPSWLIKTFGADFFHTVTEVRIHNRHTMQLLYQLPFVECV